jgi:predicted nucleic acid-binding protein
VILVDTSAWIEFSRGTGSPAHRRLKVALEAEEPLATTGVVVLELLAGARDAAGRRDLERLLARCEYLPLDEPADHEAAASLYRACRSAGATLRGVADCLVAVVAMRRGCALLHHDADFERIARHAPLAIAS